MSFMIMANTFIEAGLGRYTSGVVWPTNDCFGSHTLFHLLNHIDMSDTFPIALDTYDPSSVSQSQSAQLFLVFIDRLHSLDEFSGLISFQSTRVLSVCSSFTPSSKLPRYVLASLPPRPPAFVSCQAKST